MPGIRHTVRGTFTVPAPFDLTVEERTVQVQTVRFTIEDGWLTSIRVSGPIRFPDGSLLGRRRAARICPPQPDDGLEQGVDYDLPFSVLPYAVAQALHATQAHHRRAHQAVSGGESFPATP